MLLLLLRGSAKCSPHHPPPRWLALRDGAFAVRALLRGGAPALIRFAAVGTPTAPALDLLLESSPGAFAAAVCVTFASRGGCSGGGGLRADEGLRRALDADDALEADDALGADVITWLRHVYSLFA